jgi:hypothetical protein
MAKYVLAMFSSPVEGREDEFNRWYNDTHLGEVVSVPGFRSAQRFKRQVHVVGDIKQPYLALYELDAETPEDVKAALKAMMGAGFKLSDALEPGSLGGVFEIAGPRLGSGKVGSYRMLAMTNPREGRHDEFNHWYNTVHMQEALGIPGFATAERYRLHKQLGGQFPVEYLAFYGLEADSPEAADAILKAVFSAKLDQSHVGGGAVMSIYETVSEKVTAPEAAVG